MGLAKCFKAVLLALCLLAGPAQALDPSRSLAQLKHSRWTIEDGVPQNVRALAQTPDGYLWIGADTGLYRFDGVRFEPMPSDPNPTREEAVTALFTSRSGDLWVGHVSGRIVRIRNGRRFDQTPGQLKGPIWEFTQDRDGAIWIITGDFGFQVGRYAGGSWVHVDTSWGLPVGKNPQGFAIDRSGTVWLTLTDHLLSLPRGAKRFQDTGEAQPHSVGLAVDGKGGVWLSDSVDGTRQLSDAQGRRIRAGAHNYPVVAKSGARRMIFDRDGNIWGTTGSGGIFQIRSPASGAGSEEAYTAMDGLSSDISGPILEDREGNIWVGTTIGLDRFRAANVVVETGIARRSRWGYVLFADSRGIVYVVDSDSAYRVRPGQRPEVILRGLDNPQTLCEAADGAVWVSANNAMFAVRDTGIAKAPLPPRRFAYLDCARTGDGSLWFSLVGKGFYRFDQKGWRYFPSERTKIQPNLILADRQGRLLISVRTVGLKRMDFPSIRPLWDVEKMPGGAVRTLHQGNRDVLIGSAAGLARLRGDRIQVLNARYPWLKGVSGLVETPQGETWLLGTPGIARISSGALDKAFADPRNQLSPELFDVRDGLPPAAPFYSKNSAARGGDGRLWFVTSEAIVWIDPARIARNTLPPPVSIQSLVANGRRFSSGGAISLDPGTTSIEVNYTALSLSIPERVRFRYRLEGADQSWIDPGTRRQAFYTNLGPGTYRFRVIAANNDGVWNRTGATLAVTIPPTFLQSNWFLLIIMIGLGALLWFLYSMRVRQIAGRVRSTLEARLAERERIARELHDTLLQGFQGLVLRFQSVANQLPKDQPLRPVMDEALDRAEEVLVEGRNRVSELRSETGDLTQALADTADELSTDWPGRFHLTVEGTPRNLHPMVRDEVQRIGIEAIRNAFRYAKAGTIEAVLSYGIGDLVFQLRDDGVGLPAEVAATGAREGHYGLIGMRERAKRIGGSLTASSRPGRGTQITLSIPAAAAYADRRGRWRSWFGTLLKKVGG